MTTQFNSNAIQTIIPVFLVMLQMDTIYFRAASNNFADTSWRRIRSPCTFHAVERAYNATLARWPSFVAMTRRHQQIGCIMLPTSLEVVMVHV
jgi:hypothetical protein